ncbi:MAG: hypothetical protein JSV09_08090 [Thermoplasmata archaeon]|nr:MAG: hypothetical protein JSV09_08090 [Thermoplasmata archaeon]
MRKISQVIFSVFTVIIFLLSTSVSVTAGDEIDLGDLITEAYDGEDCVAEFDPDQQLTQTGPDTYTLSLEVPEDGNIHFWIGCYWYDYHPPPPGDYTGYHEYSLKGFPLPDVGPGYLDVYTKAGDTGYDNIGITYLDLRNKPELIYTITIYIYGYAKDLDGDSDECDPTVTVTLIY